MDLNNKIDKLAEKLEGGREDHLAEVALMRRTLKDASLKKALAQNPAMEKLIGMFRKRENSFTQVLANKEDMTEAQRAAFFQRRKEVRFILSFFESADKTLEALDKALDYQLSDEIEEGVDNSG